MADLGASPFTISATAAYTIPLGVYSLQVECQGGAAAGSNGPGITKRSGGGGGGGAYSKRAAIRVIPGKSYTFTVGVAVAAASQSNGNPTTFTGEDAVACTAAGGTCPANLTTGGAGGAVVASVGDAGAIFAGGAGGNGSTTSDQGGGGGGEGAYQATGNIGQNNVGATGGAGGTGLAGGGDGGKGGNNTAGGSDGVAPGGGGGGAGGSNDSGGAGATGQIIVTYTTNVTRSFGGGYASPGSMGFSLLLGLLGRFFCSLCSASKEIPDFLSLLDACAKEFGHVNVGPDGDYSQASAMMEFERRVHDLRLFKEARDPEFWMDDSRVVKQYDSLVGHLPDPLPKVVLHRIIGMKPVDVKDVDVRRHLVRRGIKSAA